jgi:hypothetical protein
VWSLSKGERANKYNHWMAEIMEAYASKMAKLMTSFNKVQEDLQNLRSFSDQTALLRARVIGYIQQEICKPKKQKQQKIKNLASQVLEFIYIWPENI